MGRLKHEGDAVDVTAPAATVITYGELYRIDGWTGIAMSNIASADTVRTLALEVSPSRIWYFSMPAGVAAVRGDLLNWSAGTGFKSGATDLVITGGGAGPVVKVEETKDANNVVAGRVMQHTPA